MKKIVMTLLLAAWAGPVFAYSAEQIDDLKLQRSRLTSEFQQKQKELSELTMKLHELNAKIDEAVKQGPEEHEYKSVPMRHEY